MLSCFKCGHANAIGASVCEQCALPLTRVCPHCDFVNPANFKFCGNCGVRFGGGSRAAVTQTMPDTLAQKISTLGKQIEGERRTVTVLFSDISGYTALAEKLDPEQVYDLIDRTLKAFTDEIYAHEGTIDKVMGDGVMALFGAPIAHEDDPMRAVRAALDMQHALKKINADLETRWNISLRVRIGMHTGTVVVGNIGSDLRMEYTALGDTVNVASRLQNVAEPGTILVSRPVYESAKPLFEFRELGSIRVKNRVEPVEIFEALAPRQVAGRVRGVPGLTAPMIGREHEYARVRQIIDELVSQQRGRIVLVTGNAGIGKSRLTSEIKSYLANKWATALEGACLAYGQPAYGVILQILRALFDLRDNDPEEIAREKIEGMLHDLLPAVDTQNILPYIENLFSIRIFEKEMAARLRHLTPPQLQQQTFIAIRALLIAKAKEKPLVLVFEDIHWIDPSSLELLAYLLADVENVPLLIYCNSRPAEGAGAPRLLKLGGEMYAAHFVHLPLALLSHADSIALVDLLLTIHELPESLKQMIPQRAEGNPFYLEEIIRMLIDRGIIRRGAHNWEMTPDADIENFSVPATLQGLIMTRADHLSEGARLALQCAAVIGRDFSFRLLNHVIDDSRNLPDDLAELAERQLVTLIHGGDNPQFRFAHILIQDTIYNSLLMRRREFLHHKIAIGIETLFKDRVDERIEELAFHYAESKDLDRALPYAIRAGKQAADRFANEQALHHYKRAADFLTRLNPTTAQKVETYGGLASVQTFTGDYAAATTSYLIALEIVRSTGKSMATTRQSAELMRSIGRVGERRGDFAEALRWLENALKELEDDPDLKSAERVRIYNDIGWVQYRRGEFDQAYEWRMKTLQIVEGTEHYNEMASAYNGLVALFTRKGDWARASAYAEKGLRLRERIGDLQGVSQSLTNIGVIAWEQGNWSLALEHIERSLDIKQKTGDIQGIALLNNNLSELYRERGDYSRALELAERALAIGEKIRNNNTILQALNNLAHVQILQNAHADALPILNRCLALATEKGSKERIAEAQWLMAQVALSRGEIDSAAELANRALTLAQSIGKRYEASVLTTLAQIASAQKKVTDARAFIERSIAIWSTLKNRFEIAKCQRHLAAIQRAEGNSADAHATICQAIETFSLLGAAGELKRAQSESVKLSAQVDIAR